MKVFLHIGYYKTGSTALQHFLDINRPALRECGICYPTAGRPANDLGAVGSRLPQLSVLSLGLLESVGAHMPAWYSVGKNREPDVYDAAQQWREVCAEIKAADTDLAILSSEEFVRFGEVDRAHELVRFVQQQLCDFDVSIVCYLRRPDNYLVSWYNQLIKIGIAVQRLRLTVDRFIPTIHVDFMKALRPWVDVFGQERIIIRNYEPIRSNRNGILHDFIETIGATIELNAFKLDVAANLSIPNALVELKRLSNHFAPPPHDGRKANQALQFIASHWDLPKDSEIEMLDAKNRFALYKAFEPIHKELTEIHGGDQLLFPAIEDSLFSHNTLMSDADAALKYAGLYHFALSQMR